jgi:hypothetical protein
LECGEDLSLPKGGSTPLCPVILSEAKDLLFLLNPARPESSEGLALLEAMGRKSIYTP